MEKRNKKRPAKTLFLISEHGLRFAVLDRAGGERRQLEGVDWADWDQAGRLIFTRGCALLAADEQDDITNPKLIGDFSAQRFSSIAAPEWATRW